MYDCMGKLLILSAQAEVMPAEHRRALAAPGPRAGCDSAGASCAPQQGSVTEGQPRALCALSHSCATAPVPTDARAVSCALG